VTGFVFPELIESEKYSYTKYDDKPTTTKPTQTIIIPKPYCLVILRLYVGSFSSFKNIYDKIGTNKTIEPFNI